MKGKVEEELAPLQNFKILDAFKQLTFNPPGMIYRVIVLGENSGLIEVTVELIESPPII